MYILAKKAKGQKHCWKNPRFFFRRKDRSGRRCLSTSNLAAVHQVTLCGCYVELSAFPFCPFSHEVLIYWRRDEVGNIVLFYVGMALTRNICILKQKLYNFTTNTLKAFLTLWTRNQFYSWEFINVEVVVHQCYQLPIFVFYLVTTFVQTITQKQFKHSAWF